MTSLERTVQAEHQRQEDERMSEIHEGLSRAARDVFTGVLVFVDAVIESRLVASLARISSARTYAGLYRAGDESRVWLARLGAWRAAWWGGR